MLPCLVQYIQLQACTIHTLAEPTKHVSDVAGVTLAFDMHVQTSSWQFSAQLDFCLPGPAEQARIGNSSVVKQWVGRGQVHVVSLYVVGFIPYKERSYRYA